MVNLSYGLKQLFVNAKVSEVIQVPQSFYQRQAR